MKVSLISVKRWHPSWIHIFIAFLYNKWQIPAQRGATAYISLTPDNETCNLRLRVGALNEPWLSALHHGVKCRLWSARSLLHHNTQNSRPLSCTFALRPPPCKQGLTELKWENTLQHVVVVVVIVFFSLCHLAPFDCVSYSGFTWYNQYLIFWF